MIKRINFLSILAITAMTDAHASNIQEIELDTAMVLNEVVVMASGITPVKRTAYNAQSIDTKELHNSTKNLSDALTKIPGIKMRESGGFGSDSHVTMDGFSSKHVKIFIDGVPQEGLSGSFCVNNIPVNFAERIEVYKGVVPVGFGTDAIGGIVNIITKRTKRKWFVDAAYSYGSFNTHRSHINFGQTLQKGLTYEFNAFQNYSDNDYNVYAPVEDFETGRIDKNNLIRVKRFNDRFHNEAVIGKIGITGKQWADRLMFSMTFANMYKEIQTGVRQEIVYGEKHRKGYSIMPSIEYRKRDLFTHGLDISFLANYNHDITINVDTSSYKYNWLGDRKTLNSPGEQAYQQSRSINNNWSGTINVKYQPELIHLFSFNHAFNSFNRNSASLLSDIIEPDAISKITRKNISGISYQFMPSYKWNISLFGKLYGLYTSGPIATNANQDDFIRSSRTLTTVGYGTAGTYFIIDGLQAKLSYEKAYRLPAIEEMFGDEDLEIGEIGIKPENSHNINLNLSYNCKIGQHSFIIDGALIYRSTSDYIQRNIITLSGGKYAAKYINYGKVLTKGYNISLRYNFSDWLSMGGNITHIDTRDNMKTSIPNNIPNIAYKERMPNIPYIFGDSDINFYFHNLFNRGNTLTASYDNQYLHHFSYYSSHIGSNKNDYFVPAQFSHNLSLSYSLNDGRYNISLECRNFTDEKLYDNFSLQKAGRAFYAKIRIYLSNN